MDLGLKGARVLVTAASSGLGAAAALQFSREGAIVVINSRNLNTLQETAAAINSETGNPVYTVPADITDQAAAPKMVKNAADMMNGIDILVTNAGGPPAGTFDEKSPEEWQFTARLNLFSAVNLIQASIPYLKASDKAAVLAITSISAKQPIPALTLSNTIRPAVVALMKTLSKEYGKDGIRFNSVLPGVTDTERVRELMEDRARRSGDTVDEEYAKAAAEVPIQRIGKPEEFANTAVFLCSPAAAFINGVALLIDGGASMSVM